MNKTKISVILPVYNSEKYIKQTLLNLIKQTFKEIEIIVVLDKPTDNSSSIVKELSKEDVRIKVFENPKNMGVSYSRNFGIKKANGKYLHFMDSDDLINIDFYKNLFEAVENTGADVAVSKVISEEFANVKDWFNDSFILDDNSDKFFYIKADQYSFPVRYLIKKTLWSNNNLSFPENFRYQEEKLVIPKMVLLSNYIITVPNSIYFYKNRAGSLVKLKIDKNKKKEQLILSEKQKKELEKLKDEYNINYTDDMLLKYERYKIFGKITILRKKVFASGKIIYYFCGLPIFKIQ